MAKNKKTTLDEQLKKAIKNAQPKNIGEVNNLFNTGSTEEKRTGPRVKSLPVVKTSDGNIKINASDKVISDFLKNEENKVGVANKANETNIYKREDILTNEKIRTMFGGKTNSTTSYARMPLSFNSKEELDGYIKDSAKKTVTKSAFDTAEDFINKPNYRYSAGAYKYDNSPYAGKSYSELMQARKEIDADLHSGKIDTAQADREKAAIDLWRVQTASKEELAQMRKEAEEYSKYYSDVYSEAQRMGTGYSRGMFSADVKKENEDKKRYSKDKMDSYNNLISAIDAQMKEYEVSENYDDNLMRWGKIALQSGASDEYVPTKGMSEDYDLVNYLHGNTKEIAPHLQSGNEEKQNKYKQMTSGELKLYNTLYNNNPKDAKEYLRSLDDVLSRRLTNEDAKEAAEYAQKHPILGGAKSVAQNIVMGIPAAIDNAVEGVFGDVDTYDATSRAIRDSQALREGGSEYFSKRYGETGALLYNTGLSMVENLANILLFKGIGSAVGAGAKSVANMVSFNMMASAASNGMISAADRGGNDRQILLSGIANGAAEYIFEKISIDRLFSIKGAGGWKNVLKQMGVQSVVEGSEEALTEIANILSDAMIMQGQSDNNIKRREYVLSGMSAEEATKKVFMESITQVASSAAAGAISGGIMGGSATVVSNVSHRSHMNNVGADMLKKPDALNRLIQIGIENNNTEAVRVAAQLYTDGADINNTQTGKMVESVISDVLAKKGDIADIVNVISILEGRSPEYIGSRESIDTARAVMHFVNETATKEDTALLEKSSGAVTLLTAIEGDTKAWNSVKSAAKADAEYRASKGFEQVQNAEGEMQNDVRYKIAHTTENEPVVVIENDILEGVDKANWVKTAKEAIKRFRPSIPISGRFVKVNKITGDEFTNSTYSQSLKKKDVVKYKDKLTAAGNLDEIVIASTKYINEGLNHTRTDNFKEFARGSVLMQVGERKYSGEVIIGLKANGEAVLYDIVNINNDKFDIKKKMNPKTVSSKDRTTIRQDSSPTDSISETDIAVNSQSMQGNENYSAAERYDIPKGSEIVNNIVVDEYSQKLKGENPRAYSNIIRMARRLGMNVRFVKDLTDENGKVLDGLITSKGVFINADAKNPSRFVATHEFGHRMKQAAPKEWAAYQEYVINKLKNKIFDSGRTAYDVLYEETKNAYGKDDADYINEEIAVNYAGELFDNEEMLESFIREDKWLAIKVRDWWYSVLEGLGLLNEKKKAQQMWLRAYTAAAKNVKEGKVGEYSGEKSLYLGTRAKNADLSMLKKAKRMKKRGDSMEEILKKTGWYIGMDGKWKFEISDKDARFERGYWPQDEVIKDNPLTWQMGYMEQFFQHEKLYEAYPELRKVFVIFSENMHNDNSGGVASEKLIMLNAKDNNEQLKDTLIHEIQHLIQMKEGFARGTSIEYWEKKGLRNEKLKKVREDLEKLVNSLSEEDKKLYDEFYEFLQESGAKPIAFVPGEKLDTKTERLLESLTKFKSLMSEKTWIKKAYEYNKILLNQKGAYEKLYFNTAGEIEARDAALRSDLTKNRRKEILPAMGDENTVFVEDSLEVASGSTVADKKDAYSMKSENSRSSIPGTRLSELEEKYGTVKKGAEPRRDVSLPKRTEKDNRVRQFARTAAEATTLSEETSEGVLENVADGKLSYKPISDKKAMDYAYSTLDTMGFEWVEKKVNGAIYNHSFDKNTVALAEVLLQSYDEMGNQEKAQQLIIDFAAEATRMGQSIQAISMLKKLDKNYEVSYIDKIVENLREEIIERNNKKWFGKEKSSEINVSEGLKNALREAKTEAEREAIREEIYTEVAEQLPASWVYRWNAWRYFAMLGNFRTHIRNVFGNAFFMPMIATKNVTAKLMETVGSTVTGGKMERSKTFVVSKKYRDFAKQDAVAMRNELSGGGKHNPSDIIRDKQKLFPKGLEWMRVKVGDALEAEDWIFLKHHYRVALSNYLAANKIDLDNASDEVMQRARYRALLEAQRNTYRDLSGFANAISKFSKKNAATAILAEGLMPFKKTPINVLKRGVEYSPVGLLNALTYDMAKVVKGDITASEYIDKACCGLTGTGVMALGMLLKSLGYIVGSSDDDKEKEFDKLQGIQNYSLVIGEHSYTLDWLAPFSLPFFVGVELQNMLESEQGINFRDFSKALSNITEPFFEMSMLQGISDAVNTIRASTSAETFGTVAFNIAKNYFGQAVPTLFGQIARTVDDTQRRSYDDKNMDVPQALQYFVQTQAKKIPGVSKTMQPYVDEWGRKKVTDGIFKRAFLNMISPGYYSKIETSDMEEELKRLYDEVGTEDGMSLFPSAAVKKFNLSDGSEKNLTAEEYTTMQEVQGHSAYKLLTGITGSEVYAEFDDLTRGKIVTNTYKLAKASAKRAVVGENWSGDKWIEEALSLIDGEDYSAAEDYLIYYTLKNDAVLGEKQARSFAFEKLNDIPDSVWESGLSDSAQKNYDEYIQGGDISIEEYVAAKVYYGGLKTIDKDTPNEVTPKEQMIDYIEGLDKSREDKRRLYLSMGYSKKTCPW